MEGKTRLEWRHGRGFGDPLWTATVGIFTLGVRDRVTHAEWDINIRGICGDLERAESVLAAQLAAEAAALELLANALAHFGEPGVNGQWNIAQIGNDPTVYVRMPDTHLMGRRAECISPADATRLACALLAAARVKP